MPRGNGSGPTDQNQGSGQGRKKGSGRCNGSGGGAGGFCICLNCGEKIPHQRGVSCRSVKCPKCHTLMRRERSLERRNY